MNLISSNINDLSIVAVNFNTSGYLENCIASVIEFTKGIRYEFIVVDNNSADKNSVTSLKERYPGIKLIINDKNYGFGKACNIGASGCKSKYILFLNPDILLDNNSIKGMFDYMESHSEAGMCSTLLVSPDGELDYSFNDFPSYHWEFREAFGLEVNKIIRKLLSKKEILNKSQNGFEVDWNHGACLIVRREIFEEVGGYDEDFFLYYEDTDLQYRIKKRGYKIFCLPFLRMIHIQRSSVRSETGRRIYLYYMHKSRMLFLMKNYGFMKRNIIRGFFITGMYLRLITGKYIRRINLNRTQIKMILSIYLRKV